MITRTIAMGERVRVHVTACDQISRDGLISQLRGPRIEIVDEDSLDPEVVAVVMADEMNDEAARAIRSLRRRGVCRVLMVVGRVDDRALLAAIEAGASGIIRRGQSTAQSLGEAIRAATVGQSSMPPDLVGRLLDQVGRLQRQVLNPRGLSFAGLTERQLKILKLLADGRDTGEVARELYLSERTVKTSIHEVIMRFNLRNRVHAVAYALREGLI